MQSSFNINDTLMVDENKHNELSHAVFIIEYNGVLIPKIVEINEEEYKSLIEQGASYLLGTKDQCEEFVEHIHKMENIA